MVVLGIDPGLANTGFGVVARRSGRLAALDGGVIETRAGVPPERRLAVLHQRVHDLLATHEPDAVALEALYFGQNVSTAFAVGQARGAVLVAAGERGIPCIARVNASSLRSGWYATSHPARFRPSIPLCSNLSAISSFIQLSALSHQPASRQFQPEAEC